MSLQLSSVHFVFEIPSIKFFEKTSACISYFEKIPWIKKALSLIQSFGTFLANCLGKLGLRLHQVEVKPLINPYAGLPHEISLPKLSSERIGGFENAGSTCFIASALQALRQIPKVNECLNSPASIRYEDENEDCFQITQEIKALVKKFMNSTNLGITISKEEMKNFEHLLIEYNKFHFKPNLRLPGTGGDASVVLELLFRALKLDHRTIFHERFITPDESTYEIARDFSEVEELLNEDEEDINKTIFRPNIVSIKLDEKNCRQLPSCVIEVSTSASNEKSYYALVAVIYGPSGHSLTYIKNYTNSSFSWIKCDDSVIQEKCSEIPDLGLIKGFIYSKLEKAVD